VIFSQPWHNLHFGRGDLPQSTLFGGAYEALVRVFAYSDIDDPGIGLQ
jgi:hypothetical protein